MKVEEIKLAFETNVQLAITDDIKKFQDIAFGRLISGNDFLKRAQLDYKIAENTYNQIQTMCDKAIASAKELGVSTSFFDDAKSSAKNQASKASKGQSLNVIL